MTSASSRSFFHLLFRVGNMARCLLGETRRNIKDKETLAVYDYYVIALENTHKGVLDLNSR